MNIDDITPYFISEVAGCPDETARIAVVKALRFMCTRAKVWGELMDPIDLIDDEPTYDIDTPTFAALADSVTQVWLGDRQLIGKNLEELAFLVPNWQSTFGSPLYFNTSGERQTITLYPTPRNETRQLRMRGIYMPQMSATTVPDDIARFHQEAIEMGAKAILMLQAKQQWSDPKMGDYWQQKFENKVEEIAIKTEKGSVPTSDRVIPRRFG